MYWVRILPLLNKWLWIQYIRGFLINIQFMSLEI